MGRNDHEEQEFSEEEMVEIERRIDDERFVEEKRQKARGEA